MNSIATGCALITGGAKGIGQGIASALHAEGLTVVIADIDDDAGIRVVNQLGNGARFMHLDVTSESDWAAAFEQFTQNGEQLTALVNNAGSGATASIEDATLEDWQRINDLNARGVFLGCKMAVSTMKAQGGSIVNIASALGKKALSNTCVYSATKAAVISLTESTALHCAEQQYPIRCNAVLPGFVDTPLLRNSLQQSDNPEAMLASFVGLHPANRLGRIEEIAEAVVFLVSDKCNFMTGASLSVDGAMTI